jgi:penicillin-insensitive murein DD-endopeptidase
MSLLSLAFLPFFFLPFNLPTSPTAPVQERAIETLAPRSVEAPAPRSTRSVQRRPLVLGHRAAPSGCEEASPRRTDSVSQGTPTAGRLSDSKFLTESDYLRHVDSQSCNFWGTDELTSMIDRVARRVALEYPGARLTVGELSQREGGDIHGHSSHENGRDVDLGFYYVDEDGLPYEPTRLVDVRRDKTARVDGKTLTFDVARNWKVVETLLEDDSDLNIILVNTRIRRWLLDHARETGVSNELRHRASVVLRVPKRGEHPHLNHFHTRIFCPEGDSQCRDFNGLWDWVEEARTERARSGRALASADSARGA